MLAILRWRGASRTIAVVVAIAAVVSAIAVHTVGSATPAGAQTFCGWQANYPGTTGPWGFTVTPGVEALPRQLVVRTTPDTPASLSAAVDHAIATMNSATGAGWRRGTTLSQTTSITTADRRGRPPLGEVWVVGSPWRYPGLPSGTYTSAIVERPRGGPAMPVATLVVLAGALVGAPWQRQLATVVHEFGHAAGLDHHFAPWGGICQAMSYGGGTSYGAGDTFGLRLLASRSPATPLWGNPFGRIDLARSVAGGIQVAGWAIDPDTTGPVAVHLYVDGQFARSPTAALSRPDVGRAYPFWGSAHGFDSTVARPVPGRTAQVCAFAINVGVGTTNPLLGCALVPP